MTPRRPQVIVHAPDNRGLREVSVAGRTVGRAWSLPDLRRVLRQAGMPPDLNLGHPGEVRWRADPDLWPDRPWRRRAQACFITLGLLVSAAVLFRVGLSDALRALTFGGRVMGVVFLTGALLETVAAGAVFDRWGKRATRYAAQCVLLGVVIATVTSLMFLVLQWEGGYHAGLFPLWLALVVWSAWAWSTFREKGTGLSRWRDELGDGWDTHRHEDFDHPVRMLAAGQIASAGSRLDPGDDFSKDAVIEVPLRDSSQGRLQLAADISFIRADRCKLSNSYPQSIEYSWDVDSADRKHLWDAPRWLANPGDDFFRYRSRIYRSSAIMNMTQAPDWAAMWWVMPQWHEGELFAPGETIPSMQVHIFRDPNGREVLSEDEQEPYGMKTRSTAVDRPVALLRRAAESP
ncbi:hypothetical protein [Streptomyces sp. NPDC054787]